MHAFSVHRYTHEFCETGGEELNFLVHEMYLLEVLVSTEVLIKAVSQVNVTLYKKISNLVFNVK